MSGAELEADWSSMAADEAHWARAALAANRRPVLDTPEKVAERLARLRGLRKEHVVALYLNARHREIRRETVSVGTLTASLIHPREIFAPAIAASAAGVLVVHNHPSGDHTPSPEDREVTKRLARAGELLGIPLVDHVIVSAGGHYSFRQNGML